MKARGMPSPDTADALAVTFAFSVGKRVEKQGVPRIYDPSTVNLGWMGS